MPLVENGHDTSGTTANRPTNAEIGQKYFDTTLNQQLIYDGTNWVGPAGDSPPPIVTGKLMA